MTDVPDPTPEHVLEARNTAKLSQSGAARLMGMTYAVRWSEYERGVHRMSQHTWELFLIKVGQHPSYGPKSIEEIAQRIEQLHK